MGFKQTSEGRVFFKSPDNDDLPGEPVKAAATKIPAGTTVTKDNAQMQILLLLKSLNAKLKSSREDHDALREELTGYKATIKALEEKTEKQQADYIDLEQKIAVKQSEAGKKTTRVAGSLKDTLQKLEEAKKLVKTLEERTRTHDKALESVKSDIKEQSDAQSRKSDDLEKKHKALEKAQKDQGEKMVDNVAAYVALTKRVGEAEARQETLDNKLEEAASDYLKLDRKIDKVIEDRNRILRKVERIEQTVLETRDALNAKAMVLLTDQGIGGISMPQITDETLRTDPLVLQRRLQEEALMPWWRRPLRLQPVTLVLLVILVVLVAWIISAAGNRNSSVTNVDRIGMSGTAPTVVLDTSPGSDIDQSGPSIKNFADTSDILDGYGQEDDIYTASAQPDFKNPYVTPHDDTVDDGVESVDSDAVPAHVEETAPLDYRDEEEMRVAAVTMDHAPEAVARQLNAIEPGSIRPRDTVEPPVAPPKADNVQSQKNVANEAYKKALRERIRPDPNLTNVAKKIEEKAFEGVPEAQHDMGAIYVGGHGNIKRDPERAVLWFREAAQNGVANAKYNLGVLYHQGIGVPMDLDKAITLYTEAATLGHPEALYNLGIAYIEGIGVPYNPQKAAYYFRSAARKNITEAAYNLGLIHENGLLGEAKPDVALAWYKFAADGGSTEARSAMNQLILSLGIDTADVDRIVRKVREDEQNFPDSSARNAQDEAALLSRVQSELMRRGLYPGPVDGMMGPMTRNAIMAFQKAANLRMTGEASPELLEYLGASSSSAYSTF